MDLQKQLDEAFRTQREFFEQGQSPSVQQILKDHPQLATNKDFVLDLVYHNILLHEQRGLQVHATNYIATFPQLQREIEELFLVHSALDSADFSSESMADAKVANDPVVTTSADRFTLQSEYARGGMGIVSLAVDQELDRVVAVKKLQPNFAQDPARKARFLWEAKITGNLEHPGIVPVYAMSIDGAGEAYYAMRFIQGKTLWEEIQDLYRPTQQISASDTGGSSTLESISEPRLSFRERQRRRRIRGSLRFRSVLQQLVQAARTIAYAHSKGVIHRDIKPSNIVLGRFGEALVLDWGLAKAKAAEHAFNQDWETPNEAFLERLSPNNFERTMAGSIIGTPAWMSPEQARGDVDALSERSDVYSLGAVLFCILTGTAPFLPNSMSAADQLLSLSQGVVPDPLKVDRTIPKTLGAICRKAMHADEAERYESAEAFALEIERWLADERVLAKSESPIDWLSRSFKKHKRLYFLALASLGAIGFISVLFGWQQQLAATQIRSQRDLLQQRNSELLTVSERSVAFMRAWIDGGQAERDNPHEQMVFVTEYLERTAREESNNLQYQVMLADAWHYRARAIHDFSPNVSDFANEVIEAYKKCIRYCDQLKQNDRLEANERKRFETLAANSLNNIGNIYRKDRVWGAAREAYQQALQYYDSIANSPSVEPQDLIWRANARNNSVWLEWDKIKFESEGKGPLTDRQQQELAAARRLLQQAFGDWSRARSIGGPDVIENNKGRHLISFELAVDLEVLGGDHASARTAIRALTSEYPTSPEACRYGLNNLTTLMQQKPDKATASQLGELLDLIRANKLGSAKEMRDWLQSQETRDLAASDPGIAEAIAKLVE